METTVTIRGQTVIPAAIRRSYKIRPKMHLAWIDNGRTITVLPVPRDPIKNLKGKFAGTDLLKALLESRKEERQRG